MKPCTITCCDCIQDAYVRHQKDMDALQFRLSKLQQEFESQLNVCDQLNTENQNRALDLKVFYSPYCTRRHQKLWSKKRVAEYEWHILCVVINQLILFS